MTRLFDDPSSFAEHALAGYADATDGITLVHGGVVRTETSAPGEVALVMGGGSGHFPAFAGWVGEGLAHGAACGRVFSSPSAAQILSVARNADNGGGVLFLPINYAGDMLHFTEAAEVLRTDGVDVRMVVVADDIASGGADRPEQRRGIAGSFVVAKITGAAAARGHTLDDVERVARIAAAATRTFGAAFAGCTLPGATAPLFDVPAGRVALGLGIHGEPGISEEALGTAAEVADLLVDGLFAERAPVPGAEVALLVNGLGATKYDELHLVHARVAERVRQAGMSPVSPVVGELVTSMDMAGVSVTMTYLDDECRGLWLDEAQAPAFSRRRRTGAPRAIIVPEDAEPAAPSAADDRSRAAGRAIRDGLRVARDALAREADRLGELDAVAGDGDHGAGMLRGATAALAAANGAVGLGSGGGEVLRRAGLAWSDESGGTSGALWGSGLVAASGEIGSSPIDGARALAAVDAFVAAVLARGNAQPGDKTMVDALVPFADALRAATNGGADLSVAWRQAADAAARGAESTRHIAARLGRARTHGDRSLGTPDPGAVSFALVVASLLRARRT